MELTADQIYEILEPFDIFESVASFKVRLETKSDCKAYGYGDVEIVVEDELTQVSVSYYAKINEETGAITHWIYSPGLEATEEVSVWNERADLWQAFCCEALGELNLAQRENTRLKRRLNG
jgi:hypothetical protein